MSDVRKTYVLVELATGFETEGLDWADEVKKELSRDALFIVRSATNVTPWVRENIVDSRTGETMRYLNSPFLKELK